MASKCTECKRLRAALEKNARYFTQPRATLNPLEPHRQFGPGEQRPVLLDAHDPALAQLRDLVNALGNWYDYAAFNEVAARVLPEAPVASPWIPTCLADVDACDELGPNPETGTDYDMVQVPALRAFLAELRSKLQEKPRG